MLSSEKNNKKQKILTTDFDRLREYIQSCPTVAKESPAITAALSGLDTELKRMDRDAKLKRKFSMNSSIRSSVTHGSRITKEEKSTPMVMTHTEDGKHQQVAEDESEFLDWQDVTTSLLSKPDDECSALGSRLAQLAVLEIASHGTRVQTPLAAIALALHAALISIDVGFVCIGLPDHQPKKGGFAAPIRALPKSQFLPLKWDTSPTHIALRYRRKEDSMVLRVTWIENMGEDLPCIQISLVPAAATNEEEPKVSFVVDDHLNLESFRTAFKKEGGVAPSLHYKALSTLLTNVCRTLDIGSLPTDNPEKSPLPYMDATVLPLPAAASDTLRLPSRQNNRNNPVYNPYETPTLRVFDNSRSDGHFASDIRPGFVGNHNDMIMGGGNLMGPNHPMFHGGRPGPNIAGGFGMRPRFDPVGPPGGPQDLFDPQNMHNNRRRPPKGGFGEPNPDHARPPNNFNNNNMFM